MTSPYQRGGANSSSNPGSAPDHSMFYRSSRQSGSSQNYSSATSGLRYPPLNGFAHLLNPAHGDASTTPDGSPDHPHSSYRPSFYGTASRQNGFAPGGGSATMLPAQQTGDGGPGSGRPTQQRGPRMHPYSRSYQAFFRPQIYDVNYPSTMATTGQPPVHEPRHFTPSYLKHSAYVQKLKELSEAKEAALRDGSAATIGASQGTGVGLGGSGGSGMIMPGGGGGSNLGGMGVGRSSGHAGSIKVTPVSHRGLAYNVVEQEPTASDDEDIVAPLPSIWNQDDKWGGLDVVNGGLEVKLTNPRSGGERERDHEAYSIRADHHIPEECGIYYFEVTILASKREEFCTAAVGFTSKHVSMARAPGWEPDSWGYHGDDGRTFAAQNGGKDYGPKYGVSDVIGCGINFRTGQAFFTKNGQHLGNAFRDIKGKLFPVVGLRKGGDHIRANFGQTPFVFDIDTLMRKERDHIQSEISGTSLQALAPPLEGTELVQQLVLQFLKHDGYVETARAFAEEMMAQKQALSLSPGDVVDQVKIEDDLDANNRQRIRKAILEGDIDRALKLTSICYPRVLVDNEKVYFRLKCRKFVEMIRREAELKMQADKNTSRSSNGGPRVFAHIELGNGAGGGSGDAAWEQDHNMDASEEAYDPGATLEYGKHLQAEYKDDTRRETKRALDEIFGLMAYNNPLQAKEVAHLLDRKGRVAVAEELNSAILLSLGKSERAALENLWAQTSVLIEDIREGGGPGAFVDLSDYVSQVTGPDLS